jgi:hypothetical protein
MNTAVQCRPVFFGVASCDVRIDISGPGGRRFKSSLPDHFKSTTSKIAFGTKPHNQIRQIAPRHFFQTADQAGVGREAVESVVHELLDGGTVAVDSVVSKLPKDFPDQIASSIEAGIKGRLRLLAAAETPSSQQ